ncbi:MAG TPA: hypothetical protein VG944_17310 [Fimbriimonas sp.]|nr:hypothetical protein [Fimbriimonas sp.]
MARFSVATKALRLFVAVLLFANAVGAGLCAALCNAHVCCHLMKGSTKQAMACKTGMRECCPMCKSVHSDKAQSQLSAPKPDCCAWIGKKISPPATILKALATQHQAVAILRLVVVPAVPTLAPQTFQFVESDDRAPPGPRIDAPSSRAPPVA